MILIEAMAPANSQATEKLVLPFDTRCKSRLRTTLASGEECGLFLDRGCVLRGGDKLMANDGRIVEVVAAPEPLMEAAMEENSGDPLLITKAAYHLGNRHVAVHLLPGKLRFLTDRVLGDMVRGLGLRLIEIEAPFEPESGAYGSHGAHGGHGSHGGHGDDTAKSRPRILDHFQRA